jgi:serine/threonine-protein kinase PRP4
MRSPTPESGELGELPDAVAAAGVDSAPGARRRTRSRSPFGARQASPPQQQHARRRSRSRSRDRDGWGWRRGSRSPDGREWRARAAERRRSPPGRSPGGDPPPPSGSRRDRRGHDDDDGAGARRPTTTTDPGGRAPSLSPPVDGGEALAARVEAALEAAGGGSGAEDAEAAAAAAARAARRAAILARHGGGGGGGEATARPRPPPPQAPPPPPLPPPPSPALDATTEVEVAAADPDADGIGERRPPQQQHRPAPVPLALDSHGGGGGAGGTGGGKGGGGQAGAATPDMFADDDAFDAATGAPATTATAAAGAALADAFDDAEGYYRARVGEVVAGRYEVAATLGAGVFATVVRARDSGVPTHADPSPPVPREADGAAGDGGGGAGTAAPAGGGEAALKIIRANDLMAKAAALEASILRKLADADPAGKRHCVRLLSTFEHRGHAVLAFPAAAEGNLRALAKKYGRGVGLALPAVRAYTAQLLLALAHCRNCGVIHADVKPDNILVERGAGSVLLADFGSAMWTGSGNTLTPYLASRFYRPPEVILGLPYDHPVDAWAVGCVAAELYTGKILFPGGSNNEMLALFQEARGPLPARMVRKGAFAWKHYEGVGGPGGPAPPPGAPVVFARQTVDRVTGRPARVLVPHPTASRPIAARLAGGGGDRRSVAAFADLLDRLLALDPDRRITPREALKHAFITGVEAERTGGGGRAGGR